MVACVVIVNVAVVTINVVVVIIDVLGVINIAVIFVNIVFVVDVDVVFVVIVDVSLACLFSFTSPVVVGASMAGTVVGADGLVGDSKLIYKF